VSRTALLTMRTARGFDLTMSTDLPREPDTQRPNVARMYDYFLGGAQNFAIDRETADAAAAAFPNIRAGARINRSFLRRAVRWLCDRGVDQFLDLGSGIPTVGNVHEIAYRHNPAARVAYVDYEPVAASTARALLDGDPRAKATVSITEEDIRDTAAVLTAPTVAGMLDFTRPVAVLATGVLHFLHGEQPYRMLAAYRDACPPGSYLVISHGSQVTLSDERVKAFLDAYARTPNPGLFRSVAEIRSLLDGYRLIDPGLVLLPLWHPEVPVTQQRAAESNIYGAVGLLER
jgi:O-methyltransferase involved in polyketide biosynthesis